MTYWLCITTIDNWKVTQDTKTLGFKKRQKNTVSTIHIGDKGIVYIKTSSQMKNPHIIAEFEIISDLYNDDTGLFIGPKHYPNEIFPLRCKINILKISKTPIDFRPLVQKLTFIRNKETWGFRLMGHALIKLPKVDFDFLDSKIRG